MSDEEVWPRLLIHVPLEPHWFDPNSFYPFWQIANQGWPLAKVPPGRCDAQRNLAMLQLKASDGTHLVLLDSDHYHQEDIIYRLAQRVIDDPEKLVITGLNFSRWDGLPGVWFEDGDGKPERIRELIPGIHPVFASACSVVIISREVGERIPAPWWAYPYEHVEEGRHPGTDPYFFKKLRDHGIQAWADTTLTSPHRTDETVPKTRPVVTAQITIPGVSTDTPAT